MRKLQTVIAGLGLLYLALLIGANLGCAPKYFLRADVLAGLAVTICALVLLAFAVRGEDDARRIAGIAGCGLLAGLWAQPDFTVVATPVGGVRSLDGTVIAGYAGRDRGMPQIAEA